MRARMGYRGLIILHYYYTCINGALRTSPLPSARAHPGGAGVASVAHVRGSSGAAGCYGAVLMQLEGAARGRDAKLKGGIGKAHVGDTQEDIWMGML